MLNWKYRPKTNEELAAEYKEKAQAETTVEEKPEGFASKNVKSITFIIMVALFLVFLGPVSVFTIRSQINEYRESKKAEITQEDLIELSNYGLDLTMDDIRKFKGNENKDESGTVTYFITNDSFIFYAEQMEGSDVLTYTNLQHRNKDNAKSIDIRYDDVEKFFASK